MMRFFSLAIWTLVLGCAVYGQKSMQVTVVNDGPEPVTKLILMHGYFHPASYSVSKEFRLNAPITTNTQGTFTFVAGVITPAILENGRKLYMEKYAVEVRWGGGCKKIIDLNYELPSQTVLAGAKQCGLHAFEVERMKEALYEADEAYRDKDYDTARSNYSTILNIDPKNEHALHRRGHSYMGLKKPGLAVNDFTWALEITKNPAHLIIDRGMAHFELKDWPRALVDFSRAVALEPLNKTYLSYRWVAVCKMGNKEAALADEKKLGEMGVKIATTCEQQTTK